MRRVSKPSLLLRLTLTLVLVLVCAPVEGFVLQTFPESNTIVEDVARLSKAGFEVISLGDGWRYHDAENVPRVLSLPFSFFGCNGPLELQRIFTIPDSLRGLDWSLYIPEFSYRLEVFINGELVTVNRGNHSGLFVDIHSDLLLSGIDNEIQILIQDDLNRSSTVPLQAGAFQPRDVAGIFSGVYLLGVRRHAIQSVRYEYETRTDSIKNTNLFSLSCGVRILSHVRHSQPDSIESAQPPHIRAELLNADGIVLASVEKTQRELLVSSSTHPIQLLEIPVTPWSPETPALYTLKLCVIQGNDTVACMERMIGFKQVRVEETQILLNEKPIELRGVEYVCQSPRGLTAHPALIRSDLRTIKRMGFNTIRVHGSASEVLFHTADSLGLFIIRGGVLDRVPSMLLTESLIESVRSGPLQQALQQSRAHVSVIMIATGTLVEWNHPIVHDFLADACRHLRARSPALCAVETFEECCDSETADVILRARMPYAEHAVSDEPNECGIPYLYSNLGWLSRFGTEAITDLSEATSNQSTVIETQIAEIGTLPNSAGRLIHSFADYYGAIPLIAQPLSADPAVYSSGLMTLNRREKLSAKRVSEIHAGAQPLVVSPAEPDHSGPIAFPVASLASLLLLSLYLRSNNVFRKNFRRAFRHSHGFFSDIRCRRFLPAMQSIALWAFISMTVALIAASFLHRMKADPRFELMLSALIPGAGVKVLVAQLAWNSWLAVGVAFGVCLLLLLLHALLVKIISRFYRLRVSLKQAWNYTIWSFTAIIFLLPLGAILYRLLIFQSLLYVILGLIGIAVLWSLFRILAALQNGFQTSFIGILLIVTVILLIVTGATYAALDHWLHFPAYREWICNVF